MKKRIGKIKDRILKIIFFCDMFREGWRLIRLEIYEMVYEEIQKEIVLQKLERKIIFRISWWL